MHQMCVRFYFIDSVMNYYAFKGNEKKQIKPKRKKNE